MANLNLNKAQLSNYAAIDEYTIATKSIDTAQDQKETEWINSKASTYWGYFNAVGDLKSAFIMKAIWNVGKGWKAEKETKQILENIDGWGKDTFDDILFNMEICRRVFGDAFAEIIRGNDGRISNLKPLNPGDVKIIVNKKGRIIRYEFVNVVTGTKEEFRPDEIFHLSNNRLANQIHGISDIDAVESVILAESQSFDELKKIVSFQAKPFIIFKLKTDDDTKINTFVDKVRRARQLGDDMFVPDDENLLSYEVVQVNPSNILMAWREDLRNKFYRVVGMPLILFGNAGSTESGGKIEYLGHEQVFEHDQRYIEKQIWAQLGLKIDLVPPTSLLENLKTDQNKDAQQGLEIQRNDVVAGIGK